MRNVAVLANKKMNNFNIRCASMPSMLILSSCNTFAIDEEEQAIAGRLEIRVFDATGGATIVKTTADKEPLQSKLFISVSI